MSDTQYEHRIDALRENAEWLDENYEDADKMEISKRLGMIQGDASALIRLLGEQ